MTESRRVIHAIALFGLFGSGNLGNEASVGAVLDELRRRAPHLRCTLVSDPPGDEAGLTGFEDCVPHDLAPVPRGSWTWLPSRFQLTARNCLQWLTEPLRARRTRAAVRRFEMLLIPGTGIADDYGVRPLGVPHHLQRWCRAAQSVGVPVSFLSIGAGPATHPWSRRFFRDALASASYRSYREPASRDFAAELGVDVRDDPVLPDLVFSTAGAAPPPVNWPPRVIALGVMAYFGWHATREQGQAIYQAYLDKLERLTVALLADHDVRLIIGNRGGDVRAVRDLVARVTASAPQRLARLQAPVIRSYHDVITQVQAADLVVATRFHNVLKALLSGRPVISIGYALKNDALMGAMGLAGYCHAIETFDPDTVLEQVRELSARPRAPTETIHDRITEYRSALVGQFDGLMTRLPPASEG